MLFQQLHVGDRHAPVYGFANVLDGDMSDLHGSQGFNNLQHTTFQRLP